MVASQMGEILPRRPLLGARARVEGIRRGPGEDEIERLELGLQAREQRSRNGHGSVSLPEPGQITRRTTLRVSP